jgi:2-C-methyl-D-erythritol 4-phosphate cytidylyltransferase
MQTCAIVPAAGLGLRMGSGRLRKPFLELDGVPILARTLLRFQAVKVIDALVPVVNAEDVQYCMSHIVAPYGLEKVFHVVAGGKTRQESVLRGLEATAACSMVIVHDAVRPFVTEDLVLKVLHAAADTGAAVAALPATDTLKRASETGFVLETIDRQRIWMVQTPQAFRWELLVEAHRMAAQKGWTATDDASLVERLGAPVRVVQGHRSNIKITTPEDLWLAGRILDQQRGSENNTHLRHANNGESL